jgi:small subunit ribosomal protein S20
MAHRRSSIKKIRIDKRRHAQRVGLYSDLRTQARKVEEMIASKAKDVSAVARIYFSKLDKAVKKNLIHKNLASRRKSRLTKRINALKSA